MRPENPNSPSKIKRGRKRSSGRSVEVVNKMMEALSKLEPDESMVGMTDDEIMVEAIKIVKESRADRYDSPT